ncbi:MAG: prepilin-type N-terminal cleavage/methylation domain-containing protein [Pirellulaceae bacterium]|nr:prepilin-type N-terminal cleavage/methylation domain-containing protein [Pirellulaceae bacterium]
MWLRSCQNKQRSRRAFTLIEVLLGAVLLSTLVVSSMLGFRIHQSKIRLSAHRVEAVAIADKLMSNWFHQPMGVPVGATGVIDPQRLWRWRTEPVGMSTVFGQPTLIVRLELYEDFPTPNQLLISIEFVNPVPPVAPEVVPLETTN